MVMAHVVYLVHLLSLWAGPKIVWSRRANSFESQHKNTNTHIFTTVEGAREVRTHFVYRSPFHIELRRAKPWAYHFGKSSSIESWRACRKIKLFTYLDQQNSVWWHANVKCFHIVGPTSHIRTVPIFVLNFRRNSVDQTLIRFFHQSSEHIKRGTK